jgi:hypothetical protein
VPQRPLGARYRVLLVPGWMECSPLNLHAHRASRASIILRNREFPVPGFVQVLTLDDAWCVTPDKFECISRRRSAWCTKAELSDRIDSGQVIHFCPSDQFSSPSEPSKINRDRLPRAPFANGRPPAHSTRHLQALFPPPCAVLRPYPPKHARATNAIGSFSTVSRSHDRHRSRITPFCRPFVFIF